jgi:hypothetical protein
VATGIDPQLVADFNGKTSRRPELEPADRLRPALDLDGPSGIGAGLERDRALIEPAIECFANEGLMLPGVATMVDRSLVRIALGNPVSGSDVEPTKQASARTL